MRFQQVIDRISTAFSTAYRQLFNRFIHRLSTGGGIWEVTPISPSLKTHRSNFPFSVTHTDNFTTEFGPNWREEMKNDQIIMDALISENINSKEYQYSNAPATQGGDFSEGGGI